MSSCLEIEQEGGYYRTIIRYQKKKWILNSAQETLKVMNLENNTTFGDGEVLCSEKGLHEERTLHRTKSTTQPFARGSATVLLVLLEGRGREHIVVGVGEGPDGGIRSRSGGNCTKLIAWCGRSSHLELQKKRATYG